MSHSRPGSVPVTPGVDATSGFTLVELLVAITLLALLSTMLLGGLRFALRASTATTAMTDRSSEIATAYGFLREALANAQPLPADPAGPQAAVLLDGTADGLDFAALPPAFLAPGGFYRLRIAWEAGGGHGQLTLRWQGVLRDVAEGTTPGVPPSVLLDRVERIEFAYFGRSADGQPPGWQPSWQARQTLPELIRLRIAFEDGSEAPQLIVAPRLGYGRGQGP